MAICYSSILRRRLLHVNEHSFAGGDGDLNMNTEQNRSEQTERTEQDVHLQGYIVVARQINVHEWAYRHGTGT